MVSIVLLPTPVAHSVDAMFRKHGARYRWYATGSIMLGTASMVLATAIVNVAIPSIMTAFSLSQDTAQWCPPAFSRRCRAPC